MTLSINATQDKRRQSSHIRPVVFVTIAITAPTSKTYRFSHNFRTFGGNQYLDYLLEVSEIVESFNHLDSAARPGSIFLKIHNGVYDSGTMLDEFLSVTYENAKITIEELLLGDTESRAAPTSSGPVTRFVGRIRKLSLIDDNSFSLECADSRMATEDAVDWYTIDESDPSRRDEINKRLPKPYGAGVLVQCIAYDTGQQTTLGEDITDTQTGDIDVADNTGFPTSGSDEDVMIGAEIVRMNPKALTNQINISAAGGSRGASGTTAVAHKKGETIVELDNPTPKVFIAADGVISAINDVYYRAPSGELVRITPEVTTNLADTTTISGRTLATVGITKTNIQTLKEIDNITQQPAAPDVVEEIAVAEAYTTGTDNGGERVITLDSILSDELSIQSQVGGTWNRAHRFIVLAKDDNIVINRFRVGFIAAAANKSTGYTVTFQVRMYGPGGTASASVTWATGETGGFKSAQSGWVTATAGATLNDFVNAAQSTSGDRLQIDITASNETTFNNDVFVCDFQDIVVEVEKSGAPATSAASFGGQFQIKEVFANVDGLEVPAADSTYSVAAGTLIEKDYDIARHMLQVQAGISSADLDSGWNTEGALEATNAEHAFDARDLGSKLTDLLEGLGNESRLNIYNEAGEWRIKRRRQSAPGYTAGTLEFSNENILPPGFEVSIRPLEEIWNILSARYDLDRSKSGSPDEIFRGHVDAVNAASQTKFGDRTLDPYNFQTIAANAVAQETLDELRDEQMDRRYTVAFNSPYYDTFLLELGDLIKVQLPFLAAAIDVRVLEIRRNLEQQVARITGIEVLTS